MMDDQPAVEEKAVAVIEDAGSPIASIASTMSNQQLQAAVNKMNKSREIIAKFVKDNLKEGVDFGKIEGESKSGKKFTGKPTLFKPGQEKIFSLFGIVSELEKDSETLDMLKNQPGLVAYKCNVYRNGIKIAEGRGAATVGDNGRDANSTIKIAEKRARMDACLSLGFSEYFTQDLEDPEYRKKVAPPAQQQIMAGVTDAQRKTIYALMRRSGITDKDLMKTTLVLNGYPASTKDMTRLQASEIINKLDKGEFNLVEKSAAAEPEETTFIATDEIKQEIEEKIESLGLRPPFKIKFVKETTGKVSLKQCTDADWMKLEQRVDAILTGAEKLPDEQFIDVSEGQDGTGDTKSD